MFSNLDILRAIESGHIRIVPRPEVIDACSVDLLLAAQFQTIDPTANRDPVTVEMRDEHLVPCSLPFIVLQPYEFVIARTNEIVTLADNIVAHLHGKSSLARIGLDIHSTAGIIQPGFQGVIILELFNKFPYPIKLMAGQPICALTFERLDTPTTKPYRGQFWGQS
jgi:dCTP deaminase